MKDDIFKQTVWDYYKKNKRAMPWRKDISPYNIFISEVMLQQTQVSRVLVKYPLFTRIFPNIKSLAQANTTQLLSVWQGLGYNRRALYLKKAALMICDSFNCCIPDDPIILDTLPGIGYATACSIVCFIYNKPVVFIETNIRRVYIYHYFNDKTNVDDKDIFCVIERTLDKGHAREWYWALMDYGAYLATQIDNPNKKSRRYVKQKRFKGSVREVRGGVIKLLLKRSHTLVELKNIYTDERLSIALEQLEKEEFIMKKKDIYYIK